MSWDDTVMAEVDTARSFAYGYEGGMRMFFLVLVTGCTATGSFTIVGDESGGGHDTLSVTTETIADMGPREPDLGICHINMVCEQDVIWDEPKQNCELQVSEASGFVLYQGVAGVERRGRSSLNWAKSNYSVELWENESVLFIEPHSEWRYFDGLNVGDPEWQAIDFDDDAWKIGTAPLGWDNDVTTSIESNRITSWYRRSFEIAEPAEMDPVVLYVRYDDGLVAYLNGVEVARLNMPDGEITVGTVSLTAHSGQNEVVWDSIPIDDGVLTSGENVLAIELHQTSVDSSDATLDVALATKPEGRQTDFFNMGEDQDWVLSGAYVDLTLYRNVVLYGLFNEFRPENYAPQTHYCDVTVNGDWRGLSQLTEQIRQGPHRVDIDEADGGGGSFIMKNDDTRPWFPTDFVLGGWQLIYPQHHRLSAASDANIRAYLSDWEQAARFGGDIWEYVDFDSAVDWVLLQEFGQNGDAYVLSIHIVKTDGGKITFVPWDFDISFGLSCGDSYGFDNYTGYAEDFIEPMQDDPVFQQALAARWAELRQTSLSVTAMEERLDAIEDHFGTVQDDNFLRWPEEQIINGDDWVLDFQANCPTYTWDESDQDVRKWISQRLDWMDDNIGDYPD